jgi:multidrug efflux pump subunit AcrA (membrane-fusion protein)
MTKISSAVLSIIAGSLALAGCGEPPRPPQAQRKVAVQVITAQYQMVPETLQVPGSFQPRNRITLSSQINGFVRSVNVRSGDMVNAGQVLVTLDARDAQSQKDMAQALIEEAQAGLEEARKAAQIAADTRSAAKANSDLASATFQRYRKLWPQKRTV